MTVFVSLVGFQPSAVAVALATWAGARGVPARVLLLPSHETQPIAERLVQWAGERFPYQGPLQVVPTSIPGGVAVSLAGEIIQQVLREAGAGADLVYYADPGPKAAVVLLARSLPPGTSLLHSDDQCLHICEAGNAGERWSTLPLEDLGLESLLFLYGLGSGAKPWNARALPPQVERVLTEGGAHARVRRHLAIGGVDAPVFDLAYESRGRLYGLFVVDSVDGKERLTLLRDVERLPVALHGLRPRIVIWSSREVTLRHARAAGFLSLKAGHTRVKEELDAWLRGAGPAPGQVLGDGEIVRTTVPPARGRGGQEGVSLVVCLGTDPSATLVSLMSHAPAHAWVLYDARTPVVVERARRLREALGTLPVGEVCFVPTDLQGRGISQWAKSVEGDLLHARVDITPGSKGQACALARVPGAELWSLRGQVGRAAPLTDDTQSIQLVGPPLNVAAAVGGGLLESAGEDAEEALVGRADFLALALEFLACFVMHTDLKSARLARLDEPKRRKCPHGWMVVVPLQEGNADVLVQHNRLKHQATVRGDGGFWLEQLVAHAFVKAGADEVRLNVVWAWPKVYVEQLIRGGFFAPGTRPFRREVDGVARFGSQIVVVECKTGDPLHLPTHRRAIEATAAAGFGRLAVPVLVYPRPRPELVAQGLAERNRAVVLGLAEIAHPGRLRARLEEVFQARSTLSND